MQRLATIRGDLPVSVVSFLLAVSAFAANPIPQVVGPPIPQAVVPSSGAFTLKVYGANFVPGAVVNWNHSPRSTTFISARELKAQILVESPNIVNVTHRLIRVEAHHVGSAEFAAVVAIRWLLTPRQAPATYTQNQAQDPVSFHNALHET
jgi:hypothetical protein